MIDFNNQQKKLKLKQKKSDTIFLSFRLAKITDGLYQVKWQLSANCFTLCVKVNCK